jgi:hypothetical protein
MSTVADYIAVRHTAGYDPIADPDQIIGRLGPPEALVASVRRGRMPHHLRLPVAPSRRPAPAPARTTNAEATAITLLMAGAFVLPVVSPLAALVVVSSSPRWTGAQKAAAWVLATGAVVAGMALALIAAVFAYAGGFGLMLAYCTAVAGSFLAGVTLLTGLSHQK